MHKISKIKTGFSFLDQKWGGVYTGGNYVIIGAKKSGKTILALNIIDHLVHNNFNVLFLSSERKKSLEIQSASIYFDINESIGSGILKLKKINDELKDVENLKQIIEETNPAFLIIDEITDNELESIRKDYINFLEFVEEKNITTFIISSIPQEDEDKQYLRMILKNTTGIIQLSKSSQKRNYSGAVTIKPNIGHFEGEFETSYKVEPVKGFISLADNEQSILQMFSDTQSMDLTQEDDFEYSNIYNIEEFEFLIESKIALSESTGKNYNIISFEILDNSIQPTEICDVLRKNLDAGDKISFNDKMVYVLPENFENESILNLSNKLDEILSKKLGSDSLSNKLKKTLHVLNPNFKIK